MSQKQTKVLPHAVRAGAEARTGLVASVLVGLVTLAAFAPTFLPRIGLGFTNWDDGINVYENPYLNPVTGESLWHLWTHAYERLYVPLAYTSFALDAALWGMKPAGFHLTNALLHALSAVVVFRLLRRLLHSTGGAVVGALLFALHPLQTEAVAWVTGRKDVLSGLLSLLAVQQYVRWSRTRQRGAYLLGGAAFVLALTAKPGAVAVPLMVLALDRWYLGRSWRRSLAAVLPWLAVAAIWTAVTMRAQPPAEFADPPVPVWQRPIVACDALAFYLSKLFVPVGLVAVYDRPPGSVLSHWWVYFTPIVPLALGALLWRGGPAALRGAGSLALVGLLPVLGLIRFAFQDYSTVADRYFYLSMLGVALAAGWLFAKWRRPETSAGTPPGRACVAGAVLATLTVLTILQQRTWADSESLWTHNLEYRPACPLANYNLGKVYSDRNKPEQAVPHYFRAIESRPNYMKARHNLANDLYRLGLRAEQQGRPEQAGQWYEQAKEQFEYQLRANPNVSTVYFNASLLYGQLGDQARAEELLGRAIQYPPPLAGAHVNLGNIYAKRGEYEAAIHQYRLALEIDPHHPDARSNLEKVRRRLAGPPTRPKP